MTPDYSPGYQYQKKAISYPEPAIWHLSDRWSVATGWVAIGDQVLDLAALNHDGFLTAFDLPDSILENQYLNDFIKLEKTRPLLSGNICQIFYRKKMQY